MRKFFLTGLLCLSSASSLSQEIDEKNTKARVTYEASSFWIDGVGPVESATLHMRGQINNDALVLLKRYYDRIKQVGVVNLHLDSTGGSVASAIEIGRFARDKSANVMVTEDARCASACVFVLAGGVSRHVSGKLGIHRPFLETPTRAMSAEDVKKAAIQTQTHLRAYFREMNISERLADDMMVIPSNQIKWLSTQEIALYGLGADDPVIKETIALREARKYGLTRMEYEARWRRVQELCKLGSAPDCGDNIMRGAQHLR